ncbi:MAG TPA: DUF3570 domain-containing protein [Polyangiaceae bacterium]|nr:DUF3570 domain-containing protein [Polyangiaceae bacterium]
MRTSPDPRRAAGIRRSGSNHPASRRGLLALVLTTVAWLLARTAGAQAAEVDSRVTLFHEPAKGSSMTVYTPSTDLTVRPWDFLAVTGGWEADIVSGASERVKTGPLSRAGPDAITGASVNDVRHIGRGSVTVRRDATQLRAGGSVSVENDYKSNAVHASARTDLFQHSSQLEIAYARNWDTVCDLAHAPNTDATLRQPLDNSTGCFQPNSATRSEAPIRTDALQLTWSQAWTPVLTTQVVYTGQLQAGLLSDPYRAVSLSPSGQYAQEHHPENRARQAIALRGAYYVRPLKGAVRAGVRGYRDTWHIMSGTFELEGEKYIFPWLRLRVTGRYYRQTAALFWSDDYTGGEPQYGPRGQYWSGDREVSPFSSYLAGARAVGTWAAGERRIVGIFEGLQAGLGFDVLFYGYSDFTLGGRKPSDTTAYIGSLSFTALF